MDDQHDITMFEQIKQHAAELKAHYMLRNTMFNSMEDMYHLKWEERASVVRAIENVKVTLSPRPRNAVLGAIRLLTATDPQWSVPRSINSEKAVQQADKIEKFLQQMWFAAGRIKGDPIHYDVVRSAMLYSEIHIGINSTAELLEHAKRSNIAYRKRLEKLAERTPFLFEVYNPATGYAERDITGLTAFYRSTDIMVRQFKNNWGAMAEKALTSSPGTAKLSPYDTVTLHDFYDLENRHVWIDSADAPVYQGAHGLAAIPIVSQVVEGSGLFDKPEDQREPFLLSLFRSGLWNRQNLMLTIWYTMLFGVGANPMFVEYLLDPENPPEVDYSIPGGAIRYRAGERREPMARQIIDPSMQTGWTIADELGTESTLYRQALGEPLGANAPYSSVALLSQSGRLPLNTPQRKASWAIGEAAEIALEMMKTDGRSGKVVHEGTSLELKPEDIPDTLEIVAKLDIALPQDRLTMSQIAATLSQGDDPLTSKSWVRENILNIGQSAEMTEAIWDEQTTNTFYRKFIMEQLAELAQVEQMAMQPGAASGIPGAPGPTPPPGGFMPPGQGAPPMYQPPPGGAPEMPPATPIPPIPAPGSTPLDRSI
jgi:hypothetical protein